MKFKFSAALLLSLLLVTCCASVKGKRNLVIQNGSSRPMNETTLHMGSYEAAFGSIPVREVRYVAKYPYDFAAKAKLFWNAKGVERTETINVAGVVQRGSPGTLVITVFDDHVETRFETDTGGSK